ncbi:transposase family protein [Streptomyces sp. NPDC001212]
MQFLCAPGGTPLWVSDAEPGSVPDVTAARIHTLPALHKAAAYGLPTLAGKGYAGAGIEVHVAVRRVKSQSEQAPHMDARITNGLIGSIRALGEHVALELQQHWRTLRPPE